MEKTNRFWRNTRTEKHHPDADPLDTAPPPAPAPAASPKNCVCEFCHCQLTPRGEIIRMGDVAREYRKHDEAIEAKDKEIRRLESELATVKTERDALKSGGSSPASRRVGQAIAR